MGKLHLRICLYDYGQRSIRDLITAYFELLAIPVLQVVVYDSDPGKANVSRKLHRFYVGLYYAAFSRKPEGRI
jgi:hypothetical protein